MHFTFYALDFSINPATLVIIVGFAKWLVSKKEKRKVSPKPNAGKHR